ncbi:MAG: CaiB/BaiF CoA transferase family protein [Pseudomonadales bacterium]
MTIIDCTMNLAGPFGTAMLADLGADVIKIEPPAGDPSRFGPPLPPDYANANSDEPAGVDYGGYFASINRNKRSMVLDLKQDRDKETLLQLCTKADAIVENMRSGIMDKLGVGYDAIKTRNPSIVYACIRGFGDPRTGESPYADWPAYDIVAQSMSGLAHITGPTDGGGYPCGVSVGDIYPGTLMALGLVSAVLCARQSGQGQFLDIAMYDAMLQFAETVVVNYGYEKNQAAPRGQHHSYLKPFGIYPAKDGGIAIAAPGPKHWTLLCKAMGAEDLLDDPRTINTFKRMDNEGYIDQRIAEWTTTLTRQEIMTALGGDVPIGPVNTAEDIFSDPHVAARDMITTFELPGDNPDVSIVGTPFKYTKTPAGFYRRPPTLGEHNNEILEQFGIKPE